jgi:hypothetical protein
MKYINAFLLAIFAFVSLPLAAQSQGQPAQWWLSNSLKLEEKHEGTRYRAQGEYSMYHSTGQVNAYIHNSSPQFFVRNGRRQLSAFGTISYQKLQIMSDPATRTRTYSFNPKLIYDLNPSLQWEGGILAEKNEAQFLKIRAAYYTGVIYNNMEHKTLGKLLFVAAGYENVVSTELPDELGVERLGNPIIYAQQRLMLKTIPRVNLSQTLIFIHGIQNSNVYRVDLDLKALYQINSHISGMVQYQVKYEEEPLIPELASYVEQLNTAITFGVRLSF